MKTGLGVQDMGQRAGKTGSPPPTTLVPYAMACSLWKVPCTAVQSSGSIFASSTLHLHLHLDLPHVAAPFSGSSC